jgi:gas vesicle protein
MSFIAGFMIGAVITAAAMLYLGARYKDGKK